MATITRTTHTVRCKSADNRFYADVEVLDAISLTLPNGFQICYQISKPNITSPTITDTSGDNAITQTNAIRTQQGVQPLLNTSGGGSQSTRASHIQRVTSSNNPQTAFIDIEVCDAFTITGPENSDFVIQCPTNPGVLGAPSNTSAITDNTGSGLGVPALSTSTRAQHVAKYTRQTAGGQQVTTDYTLGLIWDAIIFTGGEQTQGMPWVVQPPGLPGQEDQYFDFTLAPWGEEHVLQFPNLDPLVNGALNIGTNTNDMTVYVTDPQTGLQVPPDNTDPHVYVYFPTASQSPFLGPSPYTASGVGNIPAIDMGPIWWIRQIGSTDNVWFWYVTPIQSPKQWSFFGVPPVSVNPKWGYRGFQLLPDTSVIWILSENFPLVTLGQTGSTSLEVAAEGYFTPDPNGQFSLPGQSGGGYDLNLAWAGVGITPNASTIGTSTTVQTTGAYLGAGLPFLNFTLASFYMPFGAFDLTGPSAAEILATAESSGPASGPGSVKDVTEFGGPTPNIWEVTGLQQPPLVNPNKPWNATTNPHQQPTIAQAKEVVQTFRDLYNSCATAYNTAISTFTGGTYPGFGDAANPPPGWDFATPFGGQTVATAEMFSGPIPVGVALPYTFKPATCYLIDVDQLDPSVWNLAPVVNNGDPPVKYSSS